MLRYGSAVAIGSAVGVGGFEVNKHYFADNNNNNNNSQVNNIGQQQKTANSSTQDAEEITNPLG